MKKAFTLLEMLVVVAIVGTLIGVMIAALGGSSESAKAAKCLSNLKNLANACQTYGMASGHYPLAGSVEKVSLDESRGIRNVRQVYYELPGWLSWNSKGAYDSAPSGHTASYGWFQSAYNQDVVSSTHSFTNGALWKHVTGVRDIYVCPTHYRDRQFRSHPPKWSYVMNSAFGWDDSKGSRAKTSTYCGIEYGKLARADRRLLFAEMPFDKTLTAIAVKDTESSGTECDCTLQYKSGEGGEVIGFNHKIGKRERYAHVVFADGHTEKLRWPREGISSANLQELTQWLCEGKDCAFNGSTYEKLE